MEQYFDVSDDIHSRYTRRWSCLPLCIAFVVFLAGFVITVPPMQGRFRLDQVDWFGVFLLGLAALIFSGTIYQLRDRGVKLSLTATGLEDHRVAIPIPWTDIHSLRLHVTTLIPSGKVLRALVLKVRVGDTVKEVVIDLNHLDVEAELIAEVAYRRTLRAVGTLLADESGGIVTVESIRSGLEAGEALSRLRGNLHDRGIDEQLAKRAVELVAGHDLGRCQSCRLLYLRHVERCRVCGEQLEAYERTD